MFGLFKTSHKSNWPDWLLTHDFEKIPASTPIEELVFSALDCEMTGLRKEDQIVTVGAVDFTHDEIRLNRILDQRYPIRQNSSAAEIHGELASEHSEAVGILAKELLGFLKNRIIIGHNISIDLAKINQMISEQHSGFKLKNLALDTALTAKRLNPDIMSHVGGHDNLQLSALCENFHIPIENRHTALGDAYLTAQLFQRQLSLLQKRGIKTFKNLTRDIRVN